MCHQSVSTGGYILAGFTHEPVIRLSEELTAVAPRGLTRCFYADNGSAAVEVAVKMSFHYWRNVGRAGKRRFVTLSNSYHGETLGALAVGNVELYKSIYQPLLMDVITVPSPDCYEREAGESCGAGGYSACDETDRHQSPVVRVEFPVIRKRKFVFLVMNKITKDQCNRQDNRQRCDVDFGRHRHAKGETKTNTEEEQGVSKYSSGVL